MQAASMTLADEKTASWLWIRKGAAGKMRPPNRPQPGWLRSPSADRPRGSRRFWVACILFGPGRVYWAVQRHPPRPKGTRSIGGTISSRVPVRYPCCLRFHLWRVSRPSGLQRQDRREREPAGLWSPSHSQSVSLFYGSPFARSLELKPRRHARNRHGQLYSEHQRNRAGSEFGHEVAIRRDVT